MNQLERLKNAEVWSKILPGQLVTRVTRLHQFDGLQGVEGDRHTGMTEFHGTLFSDAKKDMRRYLKICITQIQTSCLIPSSRRGVWSNA